MFARRVAEKVASMVARRYQHIRDPEEIKRISESSLLGYYGNVHSQVGQDGILGEIFRRLNIKRGKYVEFGAWDGIYLSNGRFLYEQGWSAVLIEMSAFRCRNMQKTFPQNAVIINTVVGAPSSGLRGDRLVDILRKHNVNPEDVSLVSIDVDGPDLEIFNEMGFRPPVVVVEGGMMFSPLYEKRVAMPIAWRPYVQQPLAVMCKAAAGSEYTPVCFYQDVYLIRSDLAKSFPRLSVDQLYRDAYHFLSSLSRDWLVSQRALSRDIVNLETAHFGRFSADPLGY
jgi:hypothetical protein